MSTVMSTPSIRSFVVDDRDKGRFRVNRRAMVDPEVLALERERVFDRCWLYVGHESEVAAPHDFRARTVAGRPLIFTRNGDGHVQVFINSCTHRGALLCRSKAGNGRFLRCFYHAWTFDTSGKLVALPDEDAYGPSFDREELGLGAPPRVESYRGFWFVNYDADAVDLVTYLGSAAPVLDLFCDQGLEDGLEILGGTHEYSLRANWKLLVENSFDGYHAMPTHQRYMEMVQASGVDLSRRFGPSPDGLPRSWARELGNGHGMVGGTAGLGRDLPEGRAKAYDAARRARYRELFGPERAREMNGSRNLLIFPNLIVIDLVMGMVVRTFEPLAPDYQHVTAWQLAPRNEDPELHALRLDNFLTFWGPGGLATPDDVEALECCQRGFAAAKELAWSDISRGMLKAHPNSTDELQMRTFWRRWDQLVNGTAMSYEHRDA
ncbi:MAG: Rieske 2Fe-2S domain-containing protein [Acidimicrobiia bacterium]|nr:Rieske 2Fe-2S domain-containing protein [Acidimicrobiia bacterium]